MKKILKSKLLYLLLVLSINIVLLIVLCISVTSKDTRINNYIPSISNQTLDVSMRNSYIVKKGIVYEEIYYDAVVLENDDLYQDYIVTSASVEALSEVSKGGLIGIYNGNEVYSKYECYVTSITTNANTIVRVYNYNQYSLRVQISTDQYYSSTFNNSNDYYLCSGNNMTKTTFRAYDVSEFETTGKFYAIFACDSCDFFVNELVSVSICKRTLKYTDALYFESYIFDDKTGGKSFIYKSLGGLRVISLYCIDIIGDKAVVTCNEDNVTISNGDILYVY